MNKPIAQKRRGNTGEEGFSLVELLVALAVSLVLMGGVYQLFIGSTRSYAEQQALARLQENGRFAIDYLTRDIRLAGYLGSLQDANTFTNDLKNPSAFLTDFKEGIEGFDAATPIASGSGTWNPQLDPSIARARGGTDVLTIRGILPGGDAQLTAQPNNASADLKVSGDAGFQDHDILLISDSQGATVFQANKVTPLSGTEDNIVHNTGADTPGNSTNSLGHVFATGAEVFRVRTTSYYIAKDSTGEWGLYRTDSPPLPHATGTQELLQGVEDMQIRYGVSATADKSSPVTSYQSADQISDWSLVKSVQIALLLCTLKDIPRAAVDTHTYQLLPDPGGGTFTAPGDRRLRRVFIATVALRNRLP